MNLRTLIERLERLPADLVFPHGFGAAHSYRGYYEQLAFTPKDNVTVAEMLAEARKADGSTHHGWKGGQYTMDLDTPVHVAESGDCCDEGSMLELLFAVEGDRLREALMVAREALERIGIARNVDVPCDPTDDTKTERLCEQCACDPHYDDCLIGIAQRALARLDALSKGSVGT